MCANFHTAAEASRKIVSEEVDEKNTEKNKSTVLENLSLRALCEPEVPTKVLLFV